MAEKSAPPEQQPGLVAAFVDEIVGSPVNIALVAIMVLLVYKIFKSKTKPEEPAPEVRLPKLHRDFFTEELLPYDGTGPDGRILIAVNGNVYDVTRGGKMFYGPGMRRKKKKRKCKLRVSTHLALGNYAHT